MQQEDETVSVLKYHSVSELIEKLKHLGKLPTYFNAMELLELLKHKDENVRYYAVKNLAKLEKLELINTFSNLAENDSSSIVRKEAISAIGRIRNKQTKPILFNYLKDNNPEIVLQAIRGLLLLRVKDITLGEDLSYVTVNGKTGMWQIPIVLSAPYLARYA